MNAFQLDPHVGALPKVLMLARWNLAYLQKTTLPNLGVLGSVIAFQRPRGRRDQRGRPLWFRTRSGISFRKTMNQKIVTVIIAFIAHVLVFQSAQAYPDRPIKLVVPSPAGGPPDQIARLISDKMAAALGQPVIVENRTGGAGGIIGAESVATAGPDGHTLFRGRRISVSIAPLMYKIAGYTAATFAPVARVAESSEMLALHPSVPANTVSELVRLAKSRPGALSYGSAGVGTLPHLEGEFLKTAARIDMLHVPY